MNDRPKETEEVDEAKTDDPVVIAILDALSGGKAPTFQDVAHKYRLHHRLLQSILLDHDPSNLKSNYSMASYSHQ